MSRFTFNANPGKGRAQNICLWGPNLVYNFLYSFFLVTLSLWINFHHKIFFSVT